MVVEERERCRVHIHTWVVGHGLLPVGLLDVISRGSARHTQNLVVVLPLAQLLQPLALLIGAHPHMNTIMCECIVDRGSKTAHSTLHTPPHHPTHTHSTPAGWTGSDDWALVSVLSPDLSPPRHVSPPPGTWTTTSGSHMTPYCKVT